MNDILTCRGFDQIFAEVDSWMHSRSNARRAADRFGIPPGPSSLHVVTGKEHHCKRNVHAER